jgi:hypothetical protein
VNDCRHIAGQLAESPQLDWEGLQPGIREHLERCESCRGMWSLLARAENPPALSAQIQESIERNVLGSLQPVRPLPGRKQLAAAFFLVFVIFSAGFAAVTGSGGFAAIPAVSFAILAAAIVGVAAIVAVLLSVEMIPGERRCCDHRTVALGSLALLLGIIALAFPWESGQGLLSQSWHCFRQGAVFSLPAGVLAVLVLRWGAPLSWPAVGACAGMLAGLTGLGVLHVACPMHTANHIALEHWSVPAAGMAAGFLLGKCLPRLFRSAARTGLSSRQAS